MIFYLRFILAARAYTTLLLTKRTYTPYGITRIMMIKTPMYIIISMNIKAITTTTTTIITTTLVATIRTTTMIITPT